MKMKFAGIAILVVMLEGAALAQRYEVGVFAVDSRIGRPALGSLSPTPVDTDTNLKGEYGFGARLTINTKGYFGNELTYQQQHVRLRSTYTVTDENDVTTITGLEDKVKLQQAAYNFLVYFMPSGERWRPFVTGGAEVLKWGAPHFSQWPGGGSKNYGFNWGGGLKIKLFPHAQARLDVRQYIAGKPYTQLQYSGNTFPTSHLGGMEASSGFSVTF